MWRIPLAALFVLFINAPLHAAGRYFEVKYAPSKEPGELQLGVTYTLWLPDGVKHVRGVIVHQHGCGAGACRGGETAAYDLHWQALAKKWDCALLGPSYHQDDKQNCRLWCDPRNGSSKTFLKALGELARNAKHPEIAAAPWCLWGHSGGGFWASLVQTMYPDRIVAIWFRSGTAFGAWEKGDIERPTIPDAAYAIPMMMNPGAKEKDDKRFAGAWTGTFSMFKAYRAKGAPAGFAPDPRTAHECGDSRYLAIPFFDACLAMRLPEQGVKLRPIDMTTAWLAPPLSEKAEPAAAYKDKASEAVWLPNRRSADAWMEYVKTGAVSDTTPPPAPFAVKATAKDGAVEITWDAEADLESGLKGFIIERDGKEIGQLPEKAVGRFGRALFQPMSYHDTPERPLPVMRFVDKPAAGARHEYRVSAVNSVGLKSMPAKANAAANDAAHRRRYAGSAPVGQIFSLFKDDARLKKIGVVCVGDGSLAAYSERGQDWTFFETDRDAKKAAEEEFTFLKDARGKIRIELDDARVALQRSKETFGLLVIDAPEADAIAAHLLTREAVAVYHKRLSADGFIVFNISNRFVDLEGVLGIVAADAKCVAYVARQSATKEEKKRGVHDSLWLVMARQKEHIAPLLKSSDWQPARFKAGAKAWTDDFSNILEYLRQ